MTRTAYRRNTCRKYRKQTWRQITATRIAHRLLGRSAHIERTPKGVLLVDDDTDQIILDPEPGALAIERAATLLLLGAEPRNHAVGVFNAAEDKTYHGSASFFHPSFRLDPNALESMRRRTRRESKAAYLAMRDRALADFKERLGYEKGRNWGYRDAFMTLTMPRLKGEGNKNAVIRFNHAFRLLQKTEWMPKPRSWEASRA